MSLKNLIIGALTGFLITRRPLGALIGGIIGVFIPDFNFKKKEIEKKDDPVTRKQANTEKEEAKTKDFTYALLILFATVIKADRRTKKSEVLFIKDYLIKEFGTKKAGEMMQILKELLAKEIRVNSICHQIRLNSDYYFRLELVHLLFKLAAVDGSITNEEFSAIENIAQNLSLGQLDFIRIASMFSSYSREDNTRSKPNSLDNYYAILGLDPEASKDEIKKAFRKLSKEYHPDRVHHLGENYRKIAEEKFIKIKEAYDKVMEGK